MRRILGIKWSDHITNTKVLERAGMPSIYTFLRQRRFSWLGHVRWMEDGRIPKDLLYGELAAGKGARGRPQLHFKDVCKKDMKTVGMDISKWEELAQDRDQWRHKLTSSLSRGEEELRLSWEGKRTRRKNSLQAMPAASSYLCSLCGRDCHSRIGLHSHSRRCSSTSVDLHQAQNHDQS